MKLAKIIENIDCKVIGSTNKKVEHLTHMAQEAKPRSIYFCLSGKFANGMQWVQTALENGCDVVVCDGFVGNVALKVTEGTASMLLRMIKQQFKSDWVGMIIGLLAKPFMRRIYTRINYEEFGGALLLGVKGITVISHGRSKAYAIKNAVRVAKEAVVNDVNRQIAELVV